jgi:transcriptional regulator with XRE-family HTH domain
MTAIPTQSIARQLGHIIRSLRKERQLTGDQLGKQAGLSQSKISKLECGYLPSPETETVANILDILQASQEIRQQVDLLQAQLSMQKLGNHALYSFSYQDLVLKERQAVSIHVFVLNMIPALLQTPAYRSASLSGMGLSEEAVTRIMHESMQRQDLLFNPKIDHVFLIHETALYTRPSTISVQLVQLDRLERLVGMEHCEIGLLPTQSGLSIFELPNYIMYDAKELLYAIGPIEAYSKESKLLQQYILAFSELRQKAYYGNEAIVLIRKAVDYFRGID